MSQRGSHDPTQSPISPTSIGRIDRLCDDFEKACQAGRPPLIEDFLLQAPPSERDRLLGELLEIELDFRQRGGDFLQVEEYRARFPESADLVETVFRRTVKTRRLGDYELLEEIGRGGMGVVYKARQVYLNQTVALKILPHRYLDEPQAVSRFQQEMQSIGGLNHPNIVRAYSASKAGGVWFLAMEFVDGVNLQQFIDAGAPGGPLGVGAACEIIRQAAFGLQHAHEHELVHRDVKPANLMLCRSGQVKLLDLGLAKFHVERGHHAMVGEGQPQARLTEPGVTMGTIDFMAPEQWEDSAEADIRADIYSLGCTLFYLLTGEPPFGNPPYDTNRKRLMAHAVAPIPSLLERCPDCPQDLEDVFKSMMAKEPNERFETPAEVAKALEEFADEDELSEVLAAIPADNAWLADPRLRECPGNANLRSPDVGTARPQGAPSIGSSAFRRLNSRRIARQKFRRNVLLVLIVSLAAVVVGLVVLVALWPRGGTPKDVTPIDRTSLAADLAVLPGLNGPWWFEETPWLTPPLRQAIAGKVLSSPDLAAVLGDHPQAYLDPNTADAQKWLWETAGRCREVLPPADWQLIERLKAFADGDHDDDARAASDLDEALQKFTDGKSRVPMSAAQLHTVALLQHRIADLKHDAARAQEAKQSYDKALDAYSREKTPGSTQLLCLADSAVLSADVLGDFKEAKQRLDEVLAAKNLPLLFHVSTLVERGDIAAASATNSGEYEDHRFVYARKLLAGSDAVKPSHPFAAHVAECHAWSLIDQWKVDEAAKQFQAAYHVRLTDKEQNPLAAIYVFHDRHGMAMSSRYRGNLDSARRIYKAVVDEIQAAIADARRQRGATGPQNIPRSLRERLSNSLERWADCELYSGAASDGKVNLLLAAECYEQARITAPEWSDALVMGYKLAIVRALSNKHEDAETIVASLDSDPRPVLESSKDRVILVQQVAHAVLAATGPTPADGHELLRNFLDRLRLNPGYRDTNRRETMELQLFAAELLLNLDLANEPKRDPKSAQSSGRPRPGQLGEPWSTARDLKYLDALLAVFKGRRDIRPFLRRYYELAIRACHKNDLVQIANYLIESRMDERKDNLDAKATMVLFSFTRGEDFAIFLPQDERAKKRFALNITRDQIKQAKGKPLHLDDELVGLIKAEVTAGRPVEIFWDDAASRLSEDPDAISDRDWPFASQVDLAKLKAK